MRTRKLLLCLFAFTCMNINAMSQKRPKKIDLEKIVASSTTNSKGTRSAILEASALFDSNSKSIMITSQNGFADVKVSVTNLFTNETILSDSYSTSTSEIILNLAGLLNEGEAYRIEITIGDTVLYGDFTY